MCSVQTLLDLVRGGGLEPPRLRIRPSNVRVYQFHHLRALIVKQNQKRSSICLKMITSLKNKIFSNASDILCKAKDTILGDAF